MLIAALPLLSGCNAVLLSPSGDVALQQRNLIIISTVLMLLIIVPVILLTFLFAWRYRANNKAAHYDPEWNHSTVLELLIWAAPLLIIIALGALTWVSTHQLDPYRPLARAVRRPRGAARHQAAGGGSGGAGLEMAVPLSRTGRRRRQ